MKRQNIPRRLCILLAVALIAAALWGMPVYAVEEHVAQKVDISSLETGIHVISSAEAMIDVTPAGKGFVLCKYTTNAANARIDIAKFGGSVSQYPWSKKNEYGVFSLSEGDGMYIIRVLIDKGDGRLLKVCETTIDVTIEDDSAIYLTPNAMVNYGEETAKKSWKIVDEAKTKFEKLEAVYSFIVENIAYDYEKLETDRTGYRPNAEETLITGEGICIDYAVLAAALLRLEGIPTQVQFGTPPGDPADYPTHAWISVYMEEGGLLGDIPVKAGVWTQLDPTFAANDPYFSGICEGYTVMAIY